MKKRNSDKMPLKVFWRMIKYIFQTIPREMSLYCIIDVLHALSIVLSIYGMKILINAAEGVSKGKEICTVLFPLFLFAFFSVFTEICNGLGNFHFEYLSPRMIICLKEKLHKKIASLDVINFENSEICDMIDKGKKGVEVGLETTFFVISIFTLYVPYYLFMGIYLKNLSPILLLVLLLVFLPVIAGSYLRFKIFAKVEDNAAPLRRKMQYYEKAICDISSFKETRLLGAFQFFYSRFSDAKNELNASLFRAEKKYAKMDFVLQGLTTGGYIGVLILLTKEMLSGYISAGDFASVFTGLTMMYGLAQEVFVGTLRWISKYAVSLINYWKIIDLEPETRDALEENIVIDDFREKIVLRNVSFCYPGKKVSAISDVSLDIQYKKTIAIVGENGSGKTTLVKIILGMLPPTTGAVYFDGKILKNLHRREEMQKMSAVFQDYQRYQMTLEDNIFIGRPNQNAKEEEEKIDISIKQADIELDKKTYPKGKNTMLSSAFGGVDVSGGQWQRVAIARGLYRDHSVIVLDEPTSAIDPIEETRIYKKFSEIVKNRTGIIVTHRLGSARLADQIIVMKNGRIEDCGTHEILMNKNGYYKDMFEKQAVWYM